MHQNDECGFVRICNYCNDIMFQNYEHILLPIKQIKFCCKNAFAKSISNAQELTIEDLYAKV